MRMITIGLCVALTAFGCGKGEDKNPAPQPSAQPATPPPPVAQPSAQPAAAPKALAELKITTVGNTMLYDVTTMTVAAGQPVHLTLTNNSNMILLPHNWVLVKPGTEASVAASGLKVGPDAGYIDATNDKNILASSPMAAKGTTVELTFTAPETPGTYPYICTVPGHYLKMKGKLIVTP